MNTKKGKKKVRWYVSEGGIGSGKPVKTTITPKSTIADIKKAIALIDKLVSELEREIKKRGLY